MILDYLKLALDLRSLLGRLQEPFALFVKSFQFEKLDFFVFPSERFAFLNVANFVLELLKFIELLL